MGGCERWATPKPRSWQGCCTSHERSMFDKTLEHGSRVFIAKEYKGKNKVKCPKGEKVCRIRTLVFILYRVLYNEFSEI